MLSITLSKEDALKTEGHTSKGNQMKWKKDDKWIKTDYAGYEGLVEAIVSLTLDSTSLANSHALCHFNYVKYDICQINLDNTTISGCVSNNFLTGNYELIPLQKLYRKMTGKNLAKDLAKIYGEKERIEFTVDFVKAVTGLMDFGKYISLMLEIDAFFLNEDRHLNNIAVLYNLDKGEYEYCPIFDNGMGMLADCVDYPITSTHDYENTIAAINRIKAKPFGDSFDNTLDAANALYGSHLKITMTRNEYLSKMELFLNTECLLYDDATRGRILTILREQSRKYTYLFE